LKALLVGVLLMLCLPAMAQPKAMDELLQQIQQGSQASARQNAEREQRFLRNRAEQAALLARAEADLAAANARANAAKARFAAGQAEIADLKKRLSERVGDSGQMYAAIAQSAGEFRSQLAGSLATAQFPQRIEFLDRIAAAGEIPGVRDLEQLWFLYAQEAAEGGRIARFQAEVRDARGDRQTLELVRIGLFDAISADGHLVFEPGTASLALLARQPDGAVALTRAYMEAGEGLHELMIDPTRGDLLRLIAERPTLTERIDQGGAVGYVIIAIGVLGAGLALWQLVYLLQVGARVRRQLGNVESPSDDNPLGRVLNSLRLDAGTQDPEVLETRLSEAVLRETPKLERFQSALRMIVAAGPLLGLLGTVVGMIITFQVITEVGAGDPKLMAGGISQAMIATALGLGIAIPLLFVNSFLMARSRWLTQVLDEQAAGLLAQRLEALSAAGAGRS
jgi:biopolymer transport protein ExbB